MSALSFRGLQHHYHDYFRFDAGFNIRRSAINLLKDSSGKMSEIFLKQIGDELDAISRHFGAADFPICDHMPRYGG